MPIERLGCQRLSLRYTLVVLVSFRLLLNSLFPLNFFLVFHSLDLNLPLWTLFHYSSFILEVFIVVSLVSPVLSRHHPSKNILPPLSIHGYIPKVQ